MDYHFDRKVILNPVSEHEALYKWSLQEINANGKKIGRDLIPWDWCCNFRVTDISVRDTISFETEYKDVSHDKEVVIHDRSFICAKLTPTRERDQFRETSFSMFGTGRTISQIELHIHKLENEPERCVAWGCVSYTVDLDYPKETTKDCLIFLMYVSAKRFASYAEKITSSSIDQAGLQVTGVSGFYTDWTPSIYTGSVKVLTGHNEHVVQVPENYGINPPRLDNVNKAQLYFESKCTFCTKAADTLDKDDDSDGEEEARCEKETHNQLPSFEGPTALATRAIRILSSLRIAAWIICALLLFLLFQKT
jgi:hypothetical protein